MKHKNNLLLLIFLAFAILGYLREFFFVHLNIIMYSKFYSTPPTRPLPFIMAYFQNFSYATLYYSKYVYTVFFTLLFYFLNVVALKKLSAVKEILKFLNVAYSLVLLGAIASMLYGYFINQRLQDDEYTLSRWLMGIAQSPIIFLILLASEKLYQKTTEL